MANLKDQIQQEIKRERESSEKPGQARRTGASEARIRLDEIRPRIDELPHTTDRYSLKVSYPKGAYEEVGAALELKAADGTWVAAWQVGTTVSDSVHDWEVDYNPRGVDIQRKWFTSSDDLFAYLTASIAERVVEMETD